MAKKLAVLMAIPLLLFWHWFEPAARKNNQGIEAYRGQRFQEALNFFLSAKGNKPASPVLKNNTAAALYGLKKFSAALKEFSQIDPQKKSAAPAAADLHYNLANTLFRLQEYDQALRHYRQSLLLRSDDIDAKKNLELTLKKLAARQNRPPPPPPDPQSPNQDRTQQYSSLLRFMNQNDQLLLQKRQRKPDSNRRHQGKDW